MVGVVGPEGKMWMKRKFRYRFEEHFFCLLPHDRSCTGTFLHLSMKTRDRDMLFACTGIHLHRPGWHRRSRNCREPFLKKFLLIQLPPSSLWRLEQLIVGLVSPEGKMWLKPPNRNPGPDLHFFCLLHHDRSSTNSNKDNSNVSEFYPSNLRHLLHQPPLDGLLLLLPLLVRDERRFHTKTFGCWIGST